MEWLTNKIYASVLEMNSESFVHHTEIRAERRNSSASSIRPPLLATVAHGEGSHDT